MGIAPEQGNQPSLSQNAVRAVRPFLGQQIHEPEPARGKGHRVLARGRDIFRRDGEQHRRRIARATRPGENQQGRERREHARSQRREERYPRRRPKPAARRSRLAAHDSPPYGTAPAGLASVPGVFASRFTTTSPAVPTLSANTSIDRGDAPQTSTPPRVYTLPLHGSRNQPVRETPLCVSKTRSARHSIEQPLCESRHDSASNPPGRRNAEFPHLAVIGPQVDQPEPPIRDADGVRPGGGHIRRRDRQQAWSRRIVGPREDQQRREREYHAQPQRRKNHCARGRVLPASLWDRMRRHTPILHP